jgi:LTXXQ motif family protein
MWKAALAGAIALAAIGTTSVSAEPYGSHGAASSQIAQVKSMLRLTPAQERYWPPVEAALRGLARQASSEQASDGYVQRARARVSSIAANAAGVQRVLAAARPLIRVLDAEQRQTVHALASSYGVSNLASAL